MSRAPGWWRSVARVAKHLSGDLRYGGFLGGTQASRYANLGYYEIANSSYDALALMLDGRLRRGDKVVDIGCGKGRVINYLLSLDMDLDITGIEVDETVARATAERLRGYPNVRVLIGDARRQLPASFDLLYMYNPFNANVMVEFEPLLRSRATRIVYYNPLHLDVFSPDTWDVVLHSNHDGRLEHPFAEIRRRRH